MDTKYLFTYFFILLFWAARHGTARHGTARHAWEMWPDSSWHVADGTFWHAIFFLKKYIYFY